MNRLISESAFKQYILDTFTIGEKEFDRLLDEINEFYNVGINEFIQIRHQELKKEGLLNKTIFAQIKMELEERRFKASELSLRQIRRIIYG